MPARGTRFTIRCLPALWIPAHVCVVGIGGVGSWAAEALARTGIGAITLIDMDDVCVTNTNR
ncbi:ThiF family adenylyltransferase, partial [Enterobacter hormaechei subsp. steigerwaltii]|nr:ThiF family adenylyltransferase [Enterobacter hormaechei subsp. steigerwaltii]MCU3498201.1 ThiF family adenylyltransferase [Enterobacter hormaechei subsp. steigerwaltii]MCU3807636.1 ThiF family adenylyltransferase [Enterobacter hormaechei subsp. steigerwaltii]